MFVGQAGLTLFKTGRDGRIAGLGGAFGFAGTKFLGGPLAAGLIIISYYAVYLFYAPIISFCS